MIPVYRPRSRASLDPPNRAYLRRSELQREPIGLMIRGSIPRGRRLSKGKDAEKMTAFHESGPPSTSTREQSVHIANRSRPRRSSIFTPRKNILGERLLGITSFGAATNCNNAKGDEFPTDPGGRRLLMNPCRGRTVGLLRVGRDDRRDRVCASIRGVASGRKPTRDLFQLDLEPLRRYRRNKIRDVLFSLAHVVQENPVAPDTRDRLHDSLQPHRPWLGPIRRSSSAPTAPSRSSFNKLWRSCPRSVIGSDPGFSRRRTFKP